MIGAAQIAALALSAPTLAAAQGLKVQRVAEDVRAIVGDMERRNPGNLGSNATFGLMVTEAGAILIDPGGSWKGPAALHDAIRGITDAPVRYVIDAGGQDHRWLGNGYGRAAGAMIIASAAAVEDQKARGAMQLTMLSALIGDGLDGADPAYADVTFEDAHALDPGGLSFEIVHPGAAHTPVDSFVRVPARDVVFTGDIVYVERILGMGDQSPISEWPEAFRAVAALSPAHVAPGHGHATDLAQATADTYDCLMNLRARIAALIEDGGDIIDAPKVDRSAFAYLAQLHAPAGRNAQTAYQQMEWE